MSHTFPKGISPKLNVIGQLGFELAYFEAAVQHITPQLLLHKRVKNNL